jgi:hypothetical protein
LNEEKNLWVFKQAQSMQGPQGRSLRTVIDADKNFPAQCTLLFQRDAASYLDMECLAMVGATLAARL